MALVVYCDGLCEPRNPGGYCCWAFLALEGERMIEQQYGCLGHGEGMTNNRAEYTAVIRALAWLRDNALDGVLVRTDSQLVVRQLQGLYAVNAPSIVPLYQEAITLVHAISPVLEWIPREQNALADALTRRAYAEARGGDGTEADPLIGVLGRLDTMSAEVTAWEAAFLESILRQVRQGRVLSPKQRAVVERMAATYLSAEAAADSAGQQRLL